MEYSRDLSKIMFYLLQDFGIFDEYDIIHGYFTNMEP